MIGVLSLIFLDCALLGHLFLFAHELPERVASHFQFNGNADQWISRRAYVAIMAVIGPGLSGATLAFAFTLRNAAARSLGFHLAWAGCLLVGFIFGIHLLTIRANLATPARMPMGMFWALLGAFQIGMVVWVLAIPK